MKNYSSKPKIVFFLVLLFTSYLSLFTFATTASAHVLKSDGSIGAVMHLDPEDDPVVGQQSHLHFEFKDRQKKFKPENCDCTFSVWQGEKEIFSQPLLQDTSDASLNNVSVVYTFPERDIYQVS